MAQENNKVIVWVAVVGVVLALILIGGLMVVNSNVKDAQAKADAAKASADEAKAGVNNAVNALSNIPAATINVPTAEEIAAAIDMPETEVTVEDSKISLTKSLAIDELLTKDWKKTFASKINDYTDAEGIKWSDVKDVSIRDSDVHLYSYSSQHATVDFVVKVIFDDFGDDESIKAKVRCYVSGLDRYDNYEDAEVTSCTFTQFISDSY